MVNQKTKTGSEGLGVTLWLAAGVATLFWSHRTHVAFLDAWIGKEALISTATLIYGPVAALALCISKKANFLGVAVAVTLGTLLCGMLQVVAA